MTTPNSLTCQEPVELVTEYLEGTLLPAERARFEEHLAVCPGCRIYLDQMRQTIHTLGKLTEESIAPETRQSLLQIFRDWKNG
jgi:predicted anti-sigma-YlaC factor YlaD